MVARLQHATRPGYRLRGDRLRWGQGPGRRQDGRRGDGWVWLWRRDRWRGQEWGHTGEHSGQPDHGGQFGDRVTLLGRDRVGWLTVAGCSRRPYPPAGCLLARRMPMVTGSAHTASTTQLKATMSGRMVG
jgi:hypothetical protein